MLCVVVCGAPCCGSGALNSMFRAAASCCRGGASCCRAGAACCGAGTRLAGARMQKISTMEDSRVRMQTSFF